MAKRFIVKSFNVISGFINKGDKPYWVTQTLNGDIFVSIRKSEAKIFKEDQLKEWDNKEGFEVVFISDELPPVTQLELE